MSGAVLATVAIGASCFAATAMAAQIAAAKGQPLVHQMVVKRDGATTLRQVRPKRTTVKVNGKTCVVPAATPLGSILQTAWRPHIRFRDYGSCGRRPVDSAGLFIKAIRGYVNRGLNGWVYKVGRKLGTAGAADPAGPFGDGRLRGGDRVVWFYCVFVEASCQRSLETESEEVDGRQLSVTVRAYDDAGDGVAAAGARVVARGRSGARVVRRTDAGGHADLPLPTDGRYTLRASKPGLIPAFPERIETD